MASTEAGTTKNLKGSMIARFSIDQAPLQISLQASINNANNAFQESGSSTHQLFQRSSCKEEEEDDDDDEDEEVLIQADSLGRL